MMGRSLHLPWNVDDLVRELEQTWQEIPQATIRMIYPSMPRRMAACTQARGGQHLIELVAFKCARNSYLQYFVDGLKDGEILRAIRMSNVQHLKSALLYTLKLEAATQANRTDHYSIRAISRGGGCQIMKSSIIKFSRLRR
ncbi:hypothetical protein TNCV_4522661 [Trichonephila clavipes]|nr:hypothetical protein TNCV_4522661 [Trichonephila clavipes]